MDWYLLLKVAHIICATSWVGGALAMAVLGARADRAADDSDLVAIALKVAFLGPRYFVPASLLTLLFGVLTAWWGQLFTQAWVLIGLGGFFITFLQGILVLKPSSEKVLRGYQAEGVTSLVIARSRALLRAAKLDIAIMLAIVIDMVVKPGLDDYPVLIGMGLLILSAAAYVIGDRRSAY